MSEMQVRRLVYSDLPAVLAIERRSFTTPWSLAMFVLELSKPSGDLPRGSTDGEPGRLSGLLALRRRLAPDEHRRDPGAPARRGSPAALLERLFDEAGAGRAVTRSRCARRTAAAIAMYERLRLPPAGHRRRYYHDNGEDALIMWLEVPAGRRSGCDPRDRDLLRRHLRRRRRRRPDPLERDLLAGGRSRALRRRGAGGRIAPPPRARQPGRRRGAGRGGGGARRRRLARGHPRPGPDRRAAGRRHHREGAGRGHRASRSPASTTCTGTWPPTSSSPTRSSPPSCA